MVFSMGTLLATAWTAIGIPLVAQGIRWLGKQINRAKFMEKLDADEQIMDALKIGVSNIGTSVVDGMRKELDSGNLNRDKWATICADAKRIALHQAETLLDKQGRKALSGMSGVAVDTLMRAIVDQRQRDLAAEAQPTE